MNTVIDNLSAVTGWTASGATVFGLNEVAQYVAGVGNTKSIMFEFSTTGDYVTKTMTVDITNYDELVFWAYSTSKGKSEYTVPDDFAYKIDIGLGKEYYMPVRDYFGHIVVDISAYTSIDRIRITALSTGTDYLIMSYMLISKDEFPYDIYTGIKEQIEAFRDYELGTHGVLISTISATAGDTNINFLTDVNNLNRNYLIKIKDSTNSEYHNIISKSGRNFTFGDLYDGKKLLYSYTTASVYIYLPVLFGNIQKEIIFPSVTIWGFAKELEHQISDISEYADVFNGDGSFMIRKDGQRYRHDLLIDCESDTNDYLEKLVRYVSRFLGEHRIYVNGRKCEIEKRGAATEIEPTENYDLIPKVQFPISVTIEEDVWARTSTPKVTTINIQAVPDLN